MSVVGFLCWIGGCCFWIGGCIATSNFCYENLYRPCALVFFVCDLLAAGLAHAFFISNRLVAVASLQDCWLYIGSCVQCDQSSAAVSVPIGEGDLSQLILFTISSFNFDVSLLPIQIILLVFLNFISMPSLPLMLYNMPFGMNLIPWP